MFGRSNSECVGREGSASKAQALMMERRGSASSTHARIFGLTSVNTGGHVFPDAKTGKLALRARLYQEMGLWCRLIRHASSKQQVNILKTLEELDAELDTWATTIPRFLATTKASHRAQALTNLAESFESVATLRDRNHVRSRLRAILEAAGVPASEAGL